MPLSLSTSSSLEAGRDHAELRWQLGASVLQSRRHAVGQRDAHRSSSSLCAEHGKRLCTEQTNRMRGCRSARVPLWQRLFGDGVQRPRLRHEPCCSGQSGRGARVGRDDVVTPEGVYDLSGNLKEWMSDLRGTTGSPARNVYSVRGRSFDNLPDGLRCDFSFASAPEDYAGANLGFRCCSDQPP